MKSLEKNFFTLAQTASACIFNIIVFMKCRNYTIPCSPYSIEQTNLFSSFISLLSRNQAQWEAPPSAVIPRNMRRRLTPVCFYSNLSPIDSYLRNLNEQDYQIFDHHCKWNLIQKFALYHLMMLKMMLEKMLTFFLDRKLSIN